MLPAIPGARDVARAQTRPEVVAAGGNVVDAADGAALHRYVVADVAPEQLAPAPLPARPTVGNKAGNLLKVAAAKRSAGTVPALLPLPHELVVNLLHERGVALDSLWEAFSTAQPQDAETLTPKAAQLLAQLRAQVSDAFANRPVVEVEEWLAAHADALLMARSDGNEDGKHGPNAGGGESIANLKPLPKYVTGAIGDVVTSALNERSLLQRRAAGEDIRRPPLLSVILQVMVGEIPFGAVPMSGVMHTQDMEGPTPGVTVINAAYGHNEGIVNAGAVVTDTAYVTAADDSVQYLNRIKTSRKAPTAASDGKLVTQPNTLSARATPTLSADWVRLLAKVGRELEAHFGHPLDIECTLAQGELYILQARPLVAPEAPPASYVVMSHGDGLTQLPMKVISAGAHVRRLDGVQNVVVAQTLRTALRHYLRRDDRRLVRAVLVSEMAATTSHEATTFRAAGVAVLQCDDGQRLLQWLNDSAALVCPQTHRIVRAGRGPNDEMVRMGQTEHPIEAEISHVFLPTPLAQQRAVAFVNTLALAPLSASSAELDRMPVDGLLLWLRNPHDPRAAWALGALVRRAVTGLTSLLKSRALREPAVSLGWSLVTQAQAVSRGIQNGEGGITYLAAVKWLRACFTQQP